MFFLLGATLPMPIWINNLFIFLSVLIFLMNLKENGRTLKRDIWENKPLLLFLIFYLYSIFTLSYSENLGAASFLLLEKRASFLVFPLLFAKPDKKFLFLVYSGFLAGCIVACIYLNLNSLFLIFTKKEPLIYFFTYYNRWNLFENVTFFNIHTPYLGLYLNFCIAGLLYFVIWKGMGLRRNTISSVIICYLYMNLYLTGAKMQILIGIFILLSIGIFLIFRRKSWINYPKSLLITSIISLFLVFFVFNYSQKIIEKLNLHLLTSELYWGSFPSRMTKLLEQGDDARTENWMSGVEAIRKSPLFGYGAGDSLDVLQEHRPKDTWAFVREANLHNQYLDMAVRFGLVGLIFWLAANYFALRAALKTQHYFYLLFLTIFALSLLTENFLDRQKGIVFFNLFNTAFLSYIYNEKNLNGKPIEDIQE